MAAKLKIYRAEIGGTHEWIVAAQSQKAAAAIWGTDLDVFREGRAGPTTIPALVSAAMKQPGTPLRRVLGGEGAFKPIPKGNDLEAWRLATQAEGIKPGERRRPPPSPKPVAKPRAAPARKPIAPKRDRSALDAAEAALKAFEARAKQESDGLKAEMQAVADRQAALRKSIAEERTALTAGLRAARKAFAAGAT